MPTWTPAIQRINDLGIDCTYRQLDYWCASGYLGDEYSRRHGSVRGPGWQRQFTVGDLEVLHAINEIRKISSRLDPTRACSTVRARPVNETGEILVLEHDGTARRFDHWCARPDELDHVAAVVPLRSFAAATPAGDGSDLPTGVPIAGVEDGRHRSAAVPATHAHAP